MNGFTIAALVVVVFMAALAIACVLVGSSWCGLAIACCAGLFVWMVDDEIEEEAYEDAELEIEDAE